jgi:hypothetical protein
MTGIGRLFSSNGDIYSGGFKNCEFEGQGILQTASGGSYSGTWQDGLSHGKGTLITSDGVSYMGIFENGIKQGMFMVSPGVTGSFEPVEFFNDIAKEGEWEHN